MTTSAELLTDRVLSLPDQLPPEVETNARLHFLDAVGVGLAAARVGPVRNLSSGSAAGNATGPCSVLGSTARYSASEAALINGTLIHSIEFDDTHTGSVMHGSSALAPAVLAAAQQSGADGKTMLNGFVAGWETIIRMGLAAVVADVNGNRTRPWGIDQVVGKFTKNAELGGLSEQNIDRILEAFLETANPNIDILTDLVTT